MAPRRPVSRSSTSCGCCLILILIVSSVFAAIGQVKATLALEIELVSKISNNTAISGFYGPGSWYAWLLTLGMLHGHTLTLVAEQARGREQEAEWDYDLIGASAYLVAVSIDLMNKARQVSSLGDEAGNSLLVPAMLCAERAVAVGMGSTVFTLATAHLRGPSKNRTTLVAAIALFFTFMASGFSTVAHEIMHKTAPVIWCRLHNDTILSKYDLRPMLFVDFPGMAIYAISYLPRLWATWEYWMSTVAAASIVFVCFLAYNSLKRVAARKTLARAATAGATVGLLVCLVPILAAPMAAMGAVKWVLTWLIFWWPVYILAWFPKMSIFPLSGISLLEMDQIAAFLGVIVVTLIRMVKGGWFLTRTKGSEDELVPLLPTSGGGQESTSGDEELEVDITDLDAQV
ncbi:hypothetical protein HMN09_00350200 [Mycena chlorophos]|uniref:Uncharacterized protein n=1 Tax=Mycena chlorophos TaxID=658473 RepID=A0A8H6TGF6_MYCCL|nr:hypothetical protein HMN09_00350200 [Mycena chlorophos]